MTDWDAYMAKQKAPMYREYHEKWKKQFPVPDADIHVAAHMIGWDDGKIPKTHWGGLLLFGFPIPTTETRPSGRLILQKNTLSYYTHVQTKEDPYYKIWEQHLEDVQKVVKKGIYLFVHLKDRSVTGFVFPGYNLYEEIYLENIKILETKFPPNKY